MGENTVSLTGILVSLEPLRHTPAGLPLINFRLAHRSVQHEAGFKRQVECEVNGVAIGDAATELSRQPAGTGLRITGFLDRKHRLSNQLILHAIRTELLRNENHA